MDFNTFVTKEANSTKGAGLVVIVNYDFDGYAADVTVFDDTGSFMYDEFLSNAEVDALMSDMPRATFD